MDCIIIGGGIMGLLTARELSQAGMKVCVLDQAAVGRESSWAGGGILSPLYPWRYAAPVQLLAKWGQQHYPILVDELLSDTGIDPERQVSGLLVLDNAELQVAQNWAANYPTRLELLDKSQISTLAPALGILPEQALWFPELAQVRNPCLLQSLSKDLLQRGVEIREQTQVESLLIYRGKITGVQTSAGKIEASRVVACSGAWTRDLLQDTDFKPEIEPVKGQMLMYKACPELLSQIILSGDRYIIPRKDGRILIGSTLEHTGFDKSTSQLANDDLRQVATRFIPALANYPVERHWAGLRPGTADGIPYIYADEKVAGLYVNSGHFRNGVVLGPASARLTADLILERESIISPDLYRPKTDVNAKV